MNYPRTYSGDYNSPYGPVRRYGRVDYPPYRKRNIFDSTASAINADTARGIAMRLKNDVDFVWLDMKLREIGVASPDRINLFSIIEEEQRQREKVVVLARDLPEYFRINAPSDRLRISTTAIYEGWLTDTTASSYRSKFQSEVDILVVVDGKAYFLMPNTEITVYPNYVDEDD